MPGPIEQSARDVATLSSTDYVLAFEVVSLLLLAAVIGRHLPGAARRRCPSRTSHAGASAPAPRAVAARRRAGGGAVSHSLDAYLSSPACMFAIGTFGFLAKRNAIAMLMCVELMLNAVNLAIVAFGVFTPALAGAGAGRSRCS